MRVGQKLHVLVDDDVVDEVKALPRGTQDAIFVAIYRYADSGHGGTVAYTSPGGMFVDELHVDGYAVLFSVENSDDGTPTMLVSEVSEIDGGDTENND